MKIQLDWLKTYIDHGLSVQKLSDLLTMGGLEIEGRESVDLGGGRTTEVIELNVTPNRLLPEPYRRGARSGGDDS